MIARLLVLSLAEWRHHPWRHAAALLAVALGVALAWSVHLIHAAALGEFGAAVRAANGQPDVVLRAGLEGLDDALLDRVEASPGVTVASPVLELETQALDRAGQRQTVRLVGLDVFRAAALTPELLPRATAGEGRLVALDPQALFVNAAARQALGLADGDRVRLAAGRGWQSFRVAGSVAAGGAPLAVLDVAAAQDRFGMAGRLSRLDMRLQPGVEAPGWLAALGLPAGVRAARADEATTRMSNLSRAYRVNLTVLALVALLVGAFLVFSVVGLSVAQRTPSFALLGVLGLSGRERMRLVLAECALLGLAGSLAGLLLGAALAALALRWFSADLGGGFFAGLAPRLDLQPGAALGFLLLGTLATLAGGWLPARAAAALAPAQALKGLGKAARVRSGLRMPLLLALAGAGLALLPPIDGLPLAAYAAVAAWLVGGVAALPWVVQTLARRWPEPASTPGWLAWLRTRFDATPATAAVAGVVASLALCVALTVMVASFRSGVAGWLDQVLPADLYARTASSARAGQQAWFDDGFVARASSLPGVRRVLPSRWRSLEFDPGEPPVTLIARELPDPAAQLALLSPPVANPGPWPGAFVSEAVVARHGARPGQVLALPLGGAAGPMTVFVRGVWRDYARQFGSVVVPLQDYRRLTGDERLNDLALWIEGGEGDPARIAEVQRALRAAAPQPELLEFATAGELRRISLQIFDRSFAVTVYLQAVAIAIGLVGIAASLAAQVLARRREFGLLAHLGVTPRQVRRMVVGEVAAWLAGGIAVGLALGVAIAAVLVHVVNPQSFHWTMAMVLPAGPLGALAATVLACGLLAAWLSVRAAHALPAVRAVREEG